MIIYEAKVKYSPKGEIEASTINSAKDVIPYLKTAIEENPMQESFFVIALNRKNKPMGFMRVTTGTLTATLVTPREVFRFAIQESAAAIIVAHNHPSGDPHPSSADIQVTRALREAAKIIEIELLDHVIIGSSMDDPTGLGYYSFRDAGIV